MTKKVYIKSYKTNPYSRILCINKECLEEVKNLFQDFKYKLKIEDFDDSKSICILKNDYNVSDREFWYCVLTILKNSDYEFSSYVNSKYTWYESEHLKAEEEKRLKTEKQESLQQPKERIEYGYFCDKYGCLTNITYCKNKCRYNLKYNLNCKPRKVIIKKEGI